MESPAVKKSVRPRIRAPFSPKAGTKQQSPNRLHRAASPAMLPYSPHTRIFNSRKKMTSEIQMLHERIAAAEKAKAVLSQANQRLHLEFRTLSEELSMDSNSLAKRSEKLAEKTKRHRLETARMRTRITELHTELEDAAKSRWRARMDSRTFQ